MELVGKVKLVRDEQTFASGFTKREFVITTEEKYPQDISFELLKENGSLITSYSPGDRIKVFFDIRGREYQGKYYNSLVSWKIEGQGGDNMQQPGPPMPPPMPPTAADMEDDLPF
jgi:hypothetical protein